MVDVVEDSPIFENPFAGNQAVQLSGQDTFPIPIFLADEDIFGDLIDNRPVASNDRLLDGQLCPMFVLDFYNRVHVTPQVIALGNLVSAQVRSWEVWNAFFTSNNNISLTIAGDSTGVILTEPGIPPTLYAALEARVYEINVGLTGPPAIDVVYTWVFDTETVSLELTGNRVIIFAFSPDWSDDVVERYEWATQIIEADDGGERRNRLRTNPRRSLEYRVLVTSDDKRWLETYLWDWKARLFSVPIWTDCVLTTADTPIGDLVIDVVTTDFTSFKDGGVAIFVIDQRDVEAVEIQTVDPTSLTLIRPTLKAWPSGTRIYPALVGRLTEDQPLIQPTDDIDFASFKFQFVDNEAIPAVDSPVQYTDTDGSPSFVLERVPNRATDLALTYQSKYGIVDFGINVPFVDDRSGFPDVIHKFEFAEEGREDIWFWKEWLHARAGKWSSFWIASQSSDFFPLKEIASTDVSITVTDYEYRNFYNFAQGKRDMAIFTKDGQVFYRRITSAVSTTEGEEIIGMDAPLGVDIPLNQIKIISFLHPTRLDVDGIEFAWSHTEFAKIAFATRVLGR